MNSTECRRVAIIGGGVTGLAAAWHLASNSDKTKVPIVVEIFESTDRMGGHAWTVPISTNDFVAADDSNTSTTTTTATTTMVDIGFMVFNALNYPNMIQWFQAMKVLSEPSDMSLAVSLTNTSTSTSFLSGRSSIHTAIVEWSSSDYTITRLLSTIYSFITTLGPIDTYRFVSDMLRFNSSVTTELLTLATDDPRRTISIQQYLFQQQYSTVFSTYYLYPMMAALWSASMEDVYNFPAVQVISFLQNHQMLQIFHRPVWQTVAQRSETYVRAVLKAIEDKNMSISNPHFHHKIHTNSQVISMTQNESGDYQVHCSIDNVQHVEVFHDVIFACHPPQARQIMEAMPFKTGNTTDILSLLETLASIEYADNVIYVHSDATLMPKQLNAWSSWNCIGSANHIQNKAKRMKHDTESLHKSARLDDDTTAWTTNTTMGSTTSHPQVDPTMAHLEGVNGRFKAVYVT
jgi:predicted NAD/FAD-binding protein